jgi:hypothetical protein
MSSSGWHAAQVFSIITQPKQTGGSYKLSDVPVSLFASICSFEKKVLLQISS